MKPETWKKLEEMFEDAPMMRAEGVTEFEFEEAAKTVNFGLPSDYKEFVCKFGGAIVGPYSIYGLRASSAMGLDDASAFEVTQRFKRDGWSDLDEALVISSDHSGNPVYLKPSGEIWIADHDFGEPIKLAESFEGYLLDRCLT